jgi:UTP:GlnB (protein PII) uridylyltransferase
MARHPSADFVAAFVESLPRAYAKKYDPEVVIAHAGVSAFRGTEKVAVGLFGRAGNGLCVVADDRPGLLAIFAASLVACHFDVNHAEVFTRSVPQGGKEAVDLFWVRKLDAPPGTQLVKADAERLHSVISRFLAGAEDPRVAVEKEAARTAAGPRRQVDATVRFVPDQSGGLATLEVETTDRSGLLFSLASALFSQKCQIVESEVHTDEGRVFDRFRLVELDGSPINSSHRLEIQVAVLNAIEPARRSSPPTG